MRKFWRNSERSYMRNIAKNLMKFSQEDWRKFNEILKHGVYKNGKIKIANFFPLLFRKHLGIIFFILQGGPKVQKPAHCNVYITQETVQKGVQSRAHKCWNVNLLFWPELPEHQSCLTIHCGLDFNSRWTNLSPPPPKKKILVRSWKQPTRHIDIYPDTKQIAFY